MSNHPMHERGPVYALIPLALAGLYMMYFRVTHPHLTQTEVLLELWHVWVGAWVVALIVGAWEYWRNRNR